MVLAPCDRDDPLPSGTDEEDPGPGERASARVIEVVDGDTIVVELPDGGREDVRYIGIDTPESNPDQPLECFGREAEAANSRFVAGREVGLTIGAEPRDDYGRLLAFVRVPTPGGETADGDRELFVNAELIRLGYARALTIAPNDVLAAVFERLEAEAGRAGRGLWGACDT